MLCCFFADDASEGQRRETFQELFLWIAEESHAAHAAWGRLRRIYPHAAEAMSENWNEICQAVEEAPKAVASPSPLLRPTRTRRLNEAASPPSPAGGCLVLVGALLSTGATIAACLIAGVL